MSNKYTSPFPASPPPQPLAEEEDTSRRAKAPRYYETVPYVTYTLLLINGLVFLAMWRIGHGDVTQVMSQFGDKDDTLIRSGQIWRFITAIFLHGSVTHLLVNSVSLYMLGVQMENIYGRRKYFMIYMVAGIAGYLLSFARSPISSVGASGAIFGLVGAGLVFPIRFRRLVPEKARTQILSQLFVITAINLGIGFVDKHIDNFAHVGGLLGGGFVALFLIPNVLRQEAPRRASEAVLSALVAAMLVVMGWAVFKQWEWATHDDNPSVVTYDSGGTDPWWCIRVPRTWKPIGADAWQNPKGAMIRLIDSAQDPRSVNATIVLLQQTGRTTPQLRIDGKTAWRIVGPTTAGMLDLFLVQPAPNRFLVLMLNCPANIYAPAHYDLLSMVSSWRFIHPPDQPNHLSAPNPHH